MLPRELQESIFLSWSKPPEDCFYFLKDYAFLAFDETVNGLLLMLIHFHLEPSVDDCGRNRALIVGEKIITEP